MNERRGARRLPTTAAEVLATPFTFDIIVGDFGRDASVEYVRLVAQREREMLQTILKAHGNEFFDEYRRIMYTASNDVAFLKQPAITEAAEHGALTDTILIGMGTTPISADFIGRLTTLIVQEAAVALYRGHRRIRAAIICNGLSDVAKHIGEALPVGDALIEMAKRHGVSVVGREPPGAASITVHTIPEAVMRRISAGESMPNKRRLLALGTSNTRSIYESWADAYQVEILPVDNDEQDLIDRAIVASIVGDEGEIDELRSELRSKVIEPRTRSLDGVVVVEACTDFRLHVGISSLELFVDEMIADAYSAGSPDAYGH
jgi:hypothetical protein